jgi:hypothetical protein
VLKIHCDMDGVLVHQVGRIRFDLMDWTTDGKLLWNFIKPYQPTILSQLMIDIWEVSRHEKRIWVERELGRDVPLIVVHGEDGKFPHSAPGHLLIDDSVAHRDPWIERGGTFILHRSAFATIEELKRLLSPPSSLNPLGLPWGTII